MRSRRRPTWLTGNVVVLSWVSFAQDAASELLYPVLPLFLTTVLGAPAGVVGIVEGVADAVSAWTKLLVGRLADKGDRKGLIRLGYSLALVGKALVALAFGWPVVLAGRAVDRVGKGIRGVPRDALLIDGVADHERGRVFGLHRAADSAGAVVGPLAGLGLYHLLHHRIRPMLWIALVPAAVSVALVGLVRESPRRPAGGEARADSGPRGAGSLAGAAPAFWPLMVPLMVFGAVNLPDALLLVRASQVGLSAPQVIGVYVVFNLVYSLGSYPAGWLADRARPGSVYSVGLLCFAGAVGLLAWAPSPGVVWPAFALYGLFPALTDGVGRSWVSRIVPSTMTGRALGTHQALSGFAALFAGVWAGVAWQDNGTTVLRVAGVVAAVVAVWVGLGPGRGLDGRTARSAA